MRLDAALAALRAGDVVAIPTDTVYGLAVDPTRPGATDALFALKDRPASLDLPVLVGSIDQAEALAGPDGLSRTRPDSLARMFWPGALTIVVPRRRGLDWALGGHGDTIGLRLPDHAVARTLCEVGALATTSANVHGEEPCTDAASVRRAFGSKVVVVDGGRCAGAPSTVVSLVEDVAQCLREGSVPWADISAAIGVA